VDHPSGRTSRGIDALTSHGDAPRSRDVGVRDGPPSPASPSSAWDAYGRWNEAIAHEVFAPSAAGRPVYLDIEDQVLAAIGRRVGVTEDSAQALATAVQATLQLGPGAGTVFQRHIAHLRVWRHDPRQTPPTLALLAVLSLAAEAMRHGDGMSANNYYGRLCEILAVTDEDVARKLIRDYRATPSRYGRR
jgi:hypothetical protein